VKLLRNLKNWNKAVMPNIAEEENEAGTAREDTNGDPATVEDEVKTVVRPKNVK
jgi:hypothetical protein